MEPKTKKTVKTVSFILGGVAVASVLTYVGIKILKPKVNEAISGDKDPQYFIDLENAANETGLIPNVPALMVAARKKLTQGEAERLTAVLRKIKYIRTHPFEQTSAELSDLTNELNQITAKLK